jgi:hypothetical protein
LKYSQEFLLKEIQRLKQDLDLNYAKLNYANDLRTIDQITLKTFKTKFQDLTQLLADIKKREINACHLVQVKNDYVSPTFSRGLFISSTAVIDSNGSHRSDK